MTWKTIFVWWQRLLDNCWLQVLNPLDAICNKPRQDAVCVNQLKNAKHIDKGILQERPDVKIFLPFRFLFYRPEEAFAPNTYNPYLGNYYKKKKKYKKVQIQVVLTKYLVFIKWRLIIILGRY